MSLPSLNKITKTERIFPGHWEDGPIIGMEEFEWANDLDHTPEPWRSESHRGGMMVRLWVDLRGRHDDFRDITPAEDVWADYFTVETDEWLLEAFRESWPTPEAFREWFEDPRTGTLKAAFREASRLDEWLNER